jgi:NAD(P)-dependent dehydrogenase (short-subunit alcohol dehydrogenase family)/acyl carrier protein
VACAKLAPPTRPYISNVTGTWITEKEATDPGYWVRHMREAVRFAEGVKCLLDDPEYVLLELGPGATLGGLARQQLDIAQMGRTVNVLGGPRDQGDDLENALDALGHLWLHGAAVDWQALAGSGRRRVALPTYPFERQRYWLEPSTDAVNLLAEAPLVKRADIADWFYAPSWRRMPLINVDTGSGEKFKHWLIFADNCGFGERLAARLVGDGMTATLVSVGTRFERLSDGNYRLALAEAEHYEKLLNDLTASGKLPQQVVHLWSLTGTNSSADDEIGRAFWSPLWLGRALGRLPDSDARQLSFISDGVQDVNGQEALSPQKSTLLGPWRVIQQEYPQLFCRSVDLVAPAANSAEESSLIDRLLAEFHLVATPDPVAYRGNQRWVRTYEPARLPARAPTTGLREHGVYLITGGLGGIGMAIAEDLASCVSARLVLIGRSAMPTRESWDKWLEEHPEADPVSRKIARLKAMEANGGEVMVACADVASEADMSVVIDQARQRFGAIHGVIHSAGVPAGGVIERKTRANAEAILSAKVGGTQVLDRLLADMPLDFMVLCSSLTAILGSPGQIDYTAANAYLDAYAEARNRDGNRHTLAIAWDGWSESGMAVDTEVPAAIKELRRKDLEMGIRDSEGAEVFRRALASGLSRAIVSTRDLARRLRLSAAAPKEEEGATQPDTAAVKHDRPELSTGFVAPRNDTERAVAAVWQELFGIGTIGVDDNFLEIGGHSLLAIQIVSRLDKELRIKLPVNVMFESPTVAQLAVLFEQAGQAKAEEERKLAEMLDMIENLSDEEVARLLAEREPE